MSLVFTRPVLKEGQTAYSGTDYTFGTSVVDGRFISENLRAIFQTVNGNIHASNLIPPAMTGQIRDKYIQFPEYFYPTGIEVAPGITHTHDGRDSAVLGQSAVDMTTTDYRSFGAWMFPSTKLTQIMLHGSAEITGGVAGDSTVQQLLLDIPYDRSLYLFESDSWRCFTQLRCTVPPLKGRLAISTAKIYGNTEEYGWTPYIYCVVKYNEANIPWTSTEGVFFIDWVVTALVHRTL